MPTSLQQQSLEINNLSNTFNTRTVGLVRVYSANTTSCAIFSIVFDLRLFMRFFKTISPISNTLYAYSHEGYSLRNIFMQSLTTVFCNFTDRVIVEDLAGTAIEGSSESCTKKRGNIK